MHGRLESGAPSRSMAFFTTMLPLSSRRSKHALDVELVVLRVTHPTTFSKSQNRAMLTLSWGLGILFLHAESGSCRWACDHQRAHAIRYGRMFSPEIACLAAFCSASPTATAPLAAGRWCCLRRSGSSQRAAWDCGRCRSRPAQRCSRPDGAGSPRPPRFQLPRARGCASRASRFRSAEHQQRTVPTTMTAAAGRAGVVGTETGGRPAGDRRGDDLRDAVGERHLAHHLGGAGGVVAAAMVNLEGSPCR